MVAPVAVSPLKPGSVSVISSSTKSGASIEKILPLYERTLTDSFSFTNFMASPAISSLRVICS